MHLQEPINSIGNGDNRIHLIESIVNQSSRKVGTLASKAMQVAGKETRPTVENLSFLAQAGFVILRPDSHRGLQTPSERGEIGWVENARMVIVNQ